LATTEALASTHLASGPDVEALVDAAIAVLVLRGPAELVAGQSGLDAADRTGTVGVADSEAVASARAHADLTRGVDVEAFIDGGVAVIVDPIAADLDDGLPRVDVTRRAELVERAHQGAAARAATHADVAARADVEALVEAPVAVVVQPVPAAFLARRYDLGPTEEATVRVTRNSTLSTTGADPDLAVPADVEALVGRAVAVVV
jgi:hypothetical protein